MNHETDLDQVYLQAVLDDALPLRYVNGPGLVNGISRVAPWLDPDGVRAAINEALSTLFQTPPTSFVMALCGSSPLLREDHYHALSAESKGQQTLVVVVACPVTFQQGLLETCFDEIPIMAQLVDTEELTRQLMARLRNSGVPRLAELPASLQADLMAPFLARIPARHDDSEPKQERHGLTEFRDVGITVDLSDTNPVLACGLLRAHHLGTVKVGPMIEDAHRRDGWPQLIITASCPPTEKLPVGNVHVFGLVADGRPALVVLMPLLGLIEELCATLP